MQNKKRKSMEKETYQHSWWLNL